LEEPALDLGPYEGDVAPEFRNDEFVQILRELPRHLPGDTGPQEEFRRSAVLRVELAGKPMAVKVFPAHNAARSRIAKARGTKAKKSWVVARTLEQHGVGTPHPIAFLERWQNGLLQESYYITDWLDEISSFNRQLLHLLHHEFDYDKILDLMNAVAAEVRKMHDAGVLHGDMGNQNITARRSGDSAWTDIGFIDLNRGRVKEALTLQDSRCTGAIATTTASDRPGSSCATCDATGAASHSTAAHARCAIRSAHDASAHRIPASRATRRPRTTGSGTTARIRRSAC